MDKQKRPKHLVPRDDHLRVETVTGDLTPAPSFDEIVRANEPHFAWLTRTAGPAEAARARQELIERLQLAAQYAAERSDAQRSGKDVVRMTRST